MHGLTGLLSNGLLNCIIHHGGLFNTFSFDERAGTFDDGRGQGGGGGGGKRGFHVDRAILGGQPSHCPPIQPSHCCWEPNWRGREGGKDLAMYTFPGDLGRSAAEKTIQTSGPP